MAGDLEESELRCPRCGQNSAKWSACFLPLHILSWVRHGHPWKDEKGRTFWWLVVVFYFDLVNLKEVLFVKYSVGLCPWLSTFFWYLQLKGSEVTNVFNLVQVDAYLRTVCLLNPPPVSLADWFLSLSWLINSKLLLLSAEADAGGSLLQNSCAVEPPGLRRWALGSAGSAAAAWELVLACTASHRFFVTALRFIMSFLIFVLH